MPHTDAGTEPAWLDLRHRRILGWMMLSAALVAGLAGLSALCFMLGLRLWAAGFALATMAAAPTLLFGHAQDWWHHRRGRRRSHRQRPDAFP